MFMKLLSLVLVQTLTLLTSNTPRAELHSFATGSHRSHLVIGTHVKVRMVDKLPQALAVASVTFNPDNDATFLIDLNSKKASPEVLGAAMSAMAQFATQKARNPKATIVLYIAPQASANALTPQERGRLEAILARLNGVAKGSFVEIDQG